MKTTNCLKMLCIGLSCLSLASAQDNRKPFLMPLDFKNFGTTKRNWFHPGVAVLPDGTWLATMQEIAGSDFYCNPHFAFSHDKGQTWTTPQEIESYKATPFKETNYQIGVADVRPFVSPNDGTAFVFSCTVFYSPKGNTAWEKGEKPDFPPEQGFYVTWRPETGWSKRKVLPLPEYKGNYRTACTQIAFTGSNEVLVPIYLERGKTKFGSFDSDRYGIVVGRYRQVGEELEYISMSHYIDHEAGRGAIEPSIIQLPEGGFALTIRAEDNHGYVCCSKDGMTWSDKLFWRWEDGTPLTMSSTQQHWLRVGDKVYLVYTRDDGDNTKIFRFRAPLYIAEAIPSKGVLLRKTEQVAIHRQLIDGQEALYGNFHCTQLTPFTGLVVDSGETAKQCKVMATLVTP